MTLTLRTPPTMPRGLKRVACHDGRKRVSVYARRKEERSSPFVKRIQRCRYFSVWARRVANVPRCKLDLWLETPGSTRVARGSACNPAPKVDTRDERIRELLLGAGAADCGALATELIMVVLPWDAGYSSTKLGELSVLASGLHALGASCPEGHAYTGLAFAEGPRCTTTDQDVALAWQLHAYL